MPLAAATFMRVVDSFSLASSCSRCLAQLLPLALLFELLLLGIGLSGFLLLLPLLKLAHLAVDFLEALVGHRLSGCWSAGGVTGSVGDGVCGCWVGSRIQQHNVPHYALYVRETWRGIQTVVCWALVLLMTPEPPAASVMISAVFCAAYWGGEGQGVDTGSG